MVHSPVEAAHATQPVALRVCACTAQQKPARHDPLTQPVSMVQEAPGAVRVATDVFFAFSSCGAEYAILQPELHCKDRGNMETDEECESLKHV